MNELPHRFAWLLWARGKSKAVIERTHREINARCGIEVANIIAARVAACEHAWFMTAVAQLPWRRMMK